MELYIIHLEEVRMCPAFLDHSLVNQKDSWSPTLYHDSLFKYEVPHPNYLRFFGDSKNLPIHSLNMYWSIL